MRKRMDIETKQGQRQARIMHDPELVNTLPIMMDELRSLVRVAIAATENRNESEEFYRGHLSKLLYVIERELDDADCMMSGLIHRLEQSEKAAA